MEEEGSGSALYQNRQEEDFERGYNDIFPLLPEDQSSQCPTPPEVQQPPLKCRQAPITVQSPTCSPPPRVQSSLSEDSHAKAEVALPGNTQVLPDTSSFGPAPTPDASAIRPKPDQQTPAEVGPHCNALLLALDTPGFNTKLEPDKSILCQKQDALTLHTNPEPNTSRQYGRNCPGPSTEDEHENSDVHIVVDADNMATMYLAADEKMEREKERKKKRKRKSVSNVPLMDFAKSFCSAKPELLERISIVNYFSQSFEKKHLDTICTRYLTEHASSFKCIRVGDEKNAADAKMVADLVHFHYTEQLHIRINIVSGDRGFQAIVKLFYKRRVQILSLHQRYNNNDISVQHFVEGPDHIKQKTKLLKDISEIARSNNIETVHFIHEAAISLYDGKLPSKVEAILHDPDSVKMVFRTNTEEAPAITERQIQQEDKQESTNDHCTSGEKQAYMEQQQKSDEMQAIMISQMELNHNYAKERAKLFDGYRGKLGTCIYETDPKMKDDAPLFQMEFAALSLHQEARPYNKLKFSILTKANNAFANEICRRCRGDGRDVEEVNI